MYFIIKGSVKNAIEASKQLSTHVDRRRVHLSDTGEFTVLDQVFSSSTRLPEIDFKKEDADHIIAVLKLTDCLHTALQDYVEVIRSQKH